MQHDPQVADGIAGLAAFADGLAASGKALTYTTAHRLIGQGNFVVTLSEADWAGTQTAVFDTFRLENRLIVKHWDVAEAVPCPAEANNSGKF